MSVEEQQVTPARPAASSEPQVQIQPWAATTLVGLSVVQPEQAPQPFAPRWFRAWEAVQYRRAVRRTGRRCWDISRFSGGEAGEASKPGYRDSLAAVALAAKQALAQAEANCGRRSARERMALVYFDFWGQSSHLEHAFNWRDSFDLDVIPKFLLRDHAIEAFSCKVQAGRAAFIQGLRVASELLRAGSADSVLLGGLFRFHPVLGFAEAIGNAEQERRWLGRGGQHNAPLLERAGFVVLKRADVAASTRQPCMQLGMPHYLALPAGRAASQATWHEAWQARLPQGRALLYGGHYPSSLLAEAENQALASLGDQVVYENICRRFGDSGGINPLLALQRHAQRKASDSAAPAALLSLSDSCGGTWLLRGE
ncbi:hypothetical protein A9179_16600 [Pseudomonas alcaligenes]|uniref:Uncharacterized protein n=1 Tax=Aquipseudomonas alcaligenes TaxID=43263 RepID=A0ABR7S2V1_AQUAC|nr:hypothetical protein [Pseudomonas alcaligenes]MBC9251892.1 hypothetical protein [Pseudomonas alcaligenes]